MATIQVREIPEQIYEVLRRRARRAGQSLQNYMRDQVIELASKPTKQEAIATIESTLLAANVPSPAPDAIIADLTADRR